MKCNLCLIATLLLTITACERLTVEEPDLPQKVMPGALEAKCNALYLKNKRGHRLSWKGQRPVTLTLDDSVPSEFIPSLRSAMTSFNEAVGYELFRLAPNTIAARLPNFDGVNTITWLREGVFSTAERERLRAEMQREHGLARTFYHARGNRLVETDVVFDGQSQTFSKGRLRLGSFDVESVALHELGHVLGLDHNPDEWFSIMRGWEWDFGIALRWIDATTREILSCEYE